jgi:membrane-bound inhibitor of C-type lysozyme
MRALKLIAITCAVGAASGCQPSTERQPPPASRNDTVSPADGVPVSDKREYRCGEIVVSADFHGTDPVRLRFDGKELTLPQVTSGSGARYADEAGNEFWSKGDEAMLTLAGQQMRNCAPAATPPPASG